ncbi:hypothetical protein [Shimia sediminis]|uniref:hypothetical protein n=1 Tax=Shimia sediminis TaxID=2497945 RepID=UPI000F8F3B8C|nr:hypothetical protein [Shimia sediminis]
MKLKAFPAITVLGLALPTLALASEMDANGDGVLTIEEVQAVFPDMTPEGFSALDMDSDGTLNKDEAMVAVQAGALPESATN